MAKIIIKQNLGFPKEQENACLTQVKEEEGKIQAPSTPTPRSPPPKPLDPRM